MNTAPHRSSHRSSHHRQAFRLATLLSAALLLGPVLSQAQAQEQAPIADPARPAALSVHRHLVYTLSPLHPLDGVLLAFQGEGVTGDVTVSVGGRAYVAGRQARGALTVYGLNLQELAPAGEGSVTFTVDYDAPAALAEPDLTVHYQGGSSEALQGSLPWSTPPARPPAALTERAGLIRLPQDQLITTSSNVNVSVVTPYGIVPQLYSEQNGVRVSVSPKQVGRRTDDPQSGTSRFDYVAVPLRAGQNTVGVDLPDGQHDQIIASVAGAAAQARVTLTQPLADGVQPLAVTVEVQDAEGRPTELPGVSVDLKGEEPAQPDGDPNAPGFQVRLEHGRGTLLLRPLNSPTTFELITTTNGVRQTFTLTPKQATHTLVVARGSLSVQPGQGSAAISGDAAVSAEVPFADGQLNAAFNSHGLNPDRSPMERFSTLADAGTAQPGPVSSGPLAFTYDSPKISVSAGLAQDRDPLWERHAAGDAISFETRGAARFGASYSAGANVSETLTPDGTRLLRASRYVANGTLRLTVIRSRAGLELSRQTLNSGRDYLYDREGQVITLSRALSAAEGNVDVRVLATYLSSGAGEPIWSSYLTTERGPLRVTFGVGGQDARAQFGIRAQYASAPEGLTGDARLSVDPQGGRLAEVSASVNRKAFTAAVQARTQTADYVGPAAGTPGLQGTASVSVPLNEHLSVTARAEGHRPDEFQRGPSDTASNTAGISVAPTGTTGGSVSAGVTWQDRPNGSADNFSVGAGLRAGFGDSAGTGLDLSASLTRNHWQLSAGLQPNLDGTGGYRASIAKTLNRAALKDLGLNLGGLPDNSSLTLGVGAEGGWGQTPAGVPRGPLNIRLSADVTGGPLTFGVLYTLPGLNGDDAQARYGVTANLPLTADLTSTFGYTLQRGRIDEQDLTADLRYTPAALNGALQTTLGLDLTRQTAPAVTEAAVLRSGLSFSGDTFSVSGVPFRTTFSYDGLSEWRALPAGPVQGNRYGVALAGRGANASAAATVRYRTGSLAESGVSTLLGLVSAETHDQSGSVRGELAMQSTGTSAAGVPGGSSLSAVLAAERWITPKFGLGAAYRQLWSPSGLGQALGFEATYVALPGVGLTAGYNFGGFQGFTAEPTRPGVYLRLDIIATDGNARPQGSKK